MTERIRRREALNNGDLIRVSLGDFSLQGRVISAELNSARIDGVGDTIYRYLLRGYKVERLARATPPLPTEPGAYLDKDGHPWLLLGITGHIAHHAQGRPWVAYDGHQHAADAQLSRTFGPFTKIGA